MKTIFLSILIYGIVSIGDCNELEKDENVGILMSNRSLRQARNPGQSAIAKWTSGSRDLNTLNLVNSLMSRYFST